MTLSLCSPPFPRTLLSYTLSSSPILCPPLLYCRLLLKPPCRTTRDRSPAPALPPPSYHLAAATFHLGAPQAEHTINLRGLRIRTPTCVCAMALLPHHLSNPPCHSPSTLPSIAVQTLSSCLPLDRNVRRRRHVMLSGEKACNRVRHARCCVGARSAVLQQDVVSPEGVD